MSHRAGQHQGPSDFSLLGHVGACQPPALSLLLAMQVPFSPCSTRCWAKAPSNVPKHVAICCEGPCSSDHRIPTSPACLVPSQKDCQVHKANQNTEQLNGYQQAGPRRGWSACLVTSKVCSSRLITVCHQQNERLSEQMDLHISQSYSDMKIHTQLP